MIVMPKQRFWSLLTVAIIALCFTTGCATTSSPTKAFPQESPIPELTLTEVASPIITPLVTEPSIIPSQLPIQVVLANPGFEEQESDGSSSGWSSSGAVDTVLVDERGHSGNYRLTHMGSAVYQVTTSQTVLGLENGWYTLSGWVRSSGGQNEVYLSLACGGEEKMVHVPSTSPGYRWLHISVSNQAIDGQCTINLVSDGMPDTWVSFDDIEMISGQTILTILGSDISSLRKSEDLGGIYRDADGIEKDALEILKSYGMNYARLRVWVDPADNYHDKSEILEMALRFKALDIKLLVDFHYSDDWADPGKQFKPAAWKDYDFEQLKKAVYDHTFDVCSSLVAQGTPPDMIQVGNEINAGMLWPDGDYNHFDNLAALLKEGYRAVKDCSSTTLVMLHIAEGGDNEMARWWFDNITRREVPFDVIGISYYPFWHGSLGQLQTNLDDISARYEKDVIVVETAYAFTDKNNDALANIASRNLMVSGYPYTPEGQRAMLRDIMTVVRGVANGRGIGIFYWDATWTAVPGNGWEASNPKSENAWENQALFDYAERALPALEEFSNP